MDSPSSETRMVHTPQSPFFSAGSCHKSRSSPLSGAGRQLSYRTSAAGVWLSDAGAIRIVAGSFLPSVKVIRLFSIISSSRVSPISHDTSSSSNPKCRSSSAIVRAYNCLRYHSSTVTYLTDTVVLESTTCTSNPISSTSAAPVANHPPYLQTGHTRNRTTVEPASPSSPHHATEAPSSHFTASPGIGASRKSRK